jgi:hypothetical protein
MYQDSLAMHEKALQFMRRLLPLNHPDIGILCFNIGFCHAQVGHKKAALEMTREAQRIFLTTLPSSHPHFQMVQEQVRQMECDV